MSKIIFCLMLALTILDSCSKIDKRIGYPETAEINNHAPLAGENDAPLVGGEEKSSYEEAYGKIFEKYCGYYFLAENLKDIKIIKLSFDKYPVLQEVFVTDNKTLTEGEKTVFDKIDLSYVPHPSFDNSKKTIDGLIVYYPQTTNGDEVLFLELNDIIDLFNNRRDAIMMAWERKKRQRMPRRFFLSGCTG